MPNAKQDILSKSPTNAARAKNADGAEDADNTEDDEDTDPIQSLITALQNGVDWPTALLRAMAAWRAPHDAVGDLRRDYFIGGEAFDWLLLAERLCEAAGDLIPPQERDALLFNGAFPPDFDRSPLQRTARRAKTQRLPKLLLRRHSGRGAPARR